MWFYLQCLSRTSIWISPNRFVRLGGWSTWGLFFRQRNLANSVEIGQKADQINMIEQMYFEFQLAFGPMTVCFSGTRTKIISISKICHQYNCPYILTTFFLKYYVYLIYLMENNSVQVYLNNKNKCTNKYMYYINVTKYYILVNVLINVYLLNQNIFQASEINMG